METNRSQILNEANELVNGDRNSTYGDPVQDFQRTATYCNTHIGGVLRRRLILSGITMTGDVDFVCKVVDGLLDPHDVAVMMAQLKQSRLAWSPNNRDHWVDMAGYAACGWDCSEREDD